MASYPRLTDTRQVSRPEHRQNRTPLAAQTTARGAGPQTLQAALGNPAKAPPAHLLALQRAFGNRAVGQAIQRAAAIGAEGGAVDAQTQSAIQSARGGGAPLDAKVGTQVGNVLGADFSGVRVHTDTKADALNRSLNAKAFTHGSDIFFSKGEYQPNTRGGNNLLAHELTHVVQQGGAGAQPGSRQPLQTKLVVGAAGDPYERELPLLPSL